MRSRKIKVLLISTVLFLSVVLVKGLENSRSSAWSPYSEEGLKSKKSLASFDTILSVIKSPRCMNCHPVLDRPRQGNEQHIHVFNAQRGDDNHGTEVQKCATCHHDENNAYSNVPGAPNWHLAPKSMGWYGLSDIEIAQTLTDTAKNGGRSAEDLVEHMSSDPLVLWAWEPGGDLTPPPVPLEEFKKALNNWFKNGAYIPKK